jgi:hypothetical protein
MRSHKEAVAAAALVAVAAAALVAVALGHRSEV